MRLCLFKRKDDIESIIFRLYSYYLQVQRGSSTTSTKDFHVRVVEAINKFKDCLQLRSLRACVYKHDPSYKFVSYI